MLAALTAFALSAAVISLADAMWANAAREDLPDGVPQLKRATGERSHPSDEGTHSVGIALSGGGYRAALFALGALMYVREACRAPGNSRRVFAISSVSGGSILNGLLAHTGGLAELDDGRFEDVVRALIQHATGAGSMFAGNRARWYYFALLPLTLLSVLGLAWLGILHASNPAFIRALAIAGVFVLVTVAVNRLANALGLFLLLAYPVVAVASLAAEEWRTGIAVIAIVLIALGALAYVWSQRGVLVERTVKRLIGPAGRPTRLAEIIPSSMCFVQPKSSCPSRLICRGMASRHRRLSQILLPAGLLRSEPFGLPPLFRSLSRQSGFRRCPSPRASPRSIRASRAREVSVYRVSCLPMEA